LVVKAVVVYVVRGTTVESRRNDEEDFGE